MSTEMAPKTKGGKGKRSKKEKVDPSQGGRTVMVRSSWNCRKVIALYLCDFMGTAGALYGNLAIAARGKSGRVCTITPRAYNFWA